MVSVKTEEEWKSDRLFFFSGLIENHLGLGMPIFSARVGNSLIMIFNDIPGKQLSDRLVRLRSFLMEVEGITTLISYSGSFELTDAPEVYTALKRTRGHFFFNEGGVISLEEVENRNKSQSAFTPDYESVCEAILAGDVQKATELSERFFDGVRISGVHPCLARSYCMELIVHIVRCFEAENIEKHLMQCFKTRFKTINDMRDGVVAALAEAMQQKRGSHVEHSRLVLDTLSIIEENVSNENLTLRWIAQDILYTNVDYLGKLFKKEVGENFTAYVKGKRMEMAKKLIDGGNGKIYEIAEMVGFGTNSQYFSQVFKKYTGVSPLVYKAYNKNLA